jgi:hypothetical protein
MAEQEMTYNAAGTHVLVYNPETDGRWECPPDYLPVALARGFELAGPAEDDYAGLFDDAEPQQTGFDPTEHTAAEVTDYLALHAEQSPGEVMRVLEAERAGKDRKSVVAPDGFDPNPGD